MCNSRRWVLDTRPLESLRDEARGPVVFAMPPSITRLIGAELVRELAVSAPLVQVRLVEAFTGTIREWIEAGKIDLGILSDTGPYRQLMTTSIASDELVIVGPRGRFGEISWPLQGSLSNHESDGWIVPARQHDLRQLLEREAALRSMDLRVVQEVDSIASMIELVAAGMGLALLPLCAVLDARWRGQVTLARVGDDGLWRRLNLVRNPAHVLTHASVYVGKLTRIIIDRLVAAGAWSARLEKN